MFVPDKGLMHLDNAKTGNLHLSNADDNTFYHLLNNANIDWRKILMRFAKQFNAINKHN